MPRKANETAQDGGETIPGGGTTAGTADGDTGNEELDQDPEAGGGEGEGQDGNEGESDLAESDVQADPGRAHKRIRTLAEENKALREQAESHGLRWDKESKTFVGEEDDKAAIAELEQTVLASQQESAPLQTDRQVSDDPAGWDVPRWQRWASENSFDWAELQASQTLRTLAWQKAKSDFDQRASQTVQERSLNQQAEGTIRKFVSDLDKHPQLGGVREARRTVLESIKAMRDAKVPSYQIAGALEVVEAMALKKHWPDVVKAAAGKVSREENARGRHLGGGGSRSGSDTDTVPIRLSAEQEHAAKRMGMTPEKYAARLKEM